MTAIDLNNQVFDADQKAIQSRVTFNIFYRF